jgi:hypothetical protein
VERKDAEPVGLRPFDGTRVAADWNLHKYQAGELRCYCLSLTMSAARHCNRHWRDGEIAETGCVAVVSCCCKTGQQKQSSQPFIIVIVIIFIRSPANHDVITHSNWLPDADHRFKLTYHFRFGRLEEAKKYYPDTGDDCE